MNIPKYVTDYINAYRDGKIQLNKERVMLIDYLEKYILIRDDIYFDEKMLDNYIKFTEKWYFPLQSFQKFMASFVFLFYKEDDSVFYEQFFITMARGGGKNGFISSLTHFFISPLHGIPRYNVSIVANSELQAKTSFKEIYDVIIANEVLENMFYPTKVEIKGHDTQSTLQFHTSNASTKDGLRDGCVIYDEIHQYENSDTVNVFSSGLGKVPNAREFFIGTDGFVREGFLDKMKERALNIMKGEEIDDPLFPFICKIDDPKEIDNPEMWEKANPMFSKPRGFYAKGLFKKVTAQYKQLANNPSNRQEFMTKRMNYPEVDLNLAVASWEQILRTGFEPDGETLREVPSLEDCTAVGGLDYASIKDFAAVGLLFKVNGNYIWKSHSFVRQGFLDSVSLKVPIDEWERNGLLTIIEGPVIDIEHIVDWFVKMREIYDFNTIVADTFRLGLVKQALEEEGFNLLYIRNPRAIHSQLAPQVETMFANETIIFGDNPLMRWYTNNIYVHIRKDGNKEYLKKDEIRRKTDGFQAFIHALWQADNYVVDSADFFIPNIKF